VLSRNPSIIPISLLQGRKAERTCRSSHLNQAHPDRQDNISIEHALANVDTDDFMGKRYGCSLNAVSDFFEEDLCSAKSSTNEASESLKKGHRLRE
jgi:hypothetical protein